MKVIKNVKCEVHDRMMILKKRSVVSGSGRMTCLLVFMYGNLYSTSGYECKVESFNGKPVLATTGCIIYDGKRTLIGYDFDQVEATVDIIHDTIKKVPYVLIMIGGKYRIYDMNGTIIKQDTKLFTIGNIKNCICANIKTYGILLLVNGKRSLLDNKDVNVTVPYVKIESYDRISDKVMIHATSNLTYMGYDYPYDFICSCHLSQKPIHVEIFKDYIHKHEGKDCMIWGI